jgi:hypothetical protein
MLANKGKIASISTYLTHGVMELFLQDVHVTMASDSRRIRDLGDS